MTTIYHDLTLTISPRMIVLPGDPRPEFEETKSISRGDSYNLTSMSLTTHTGTHIDVPKHFYDNGLTIDRLDLRYLVGTARVIEIRGRRPITRADLEKHAILPREIILLKTDNSNLITKDGFDPTFTFLDPDAALYLAEVGIRTLGFDYLSIEDAENQALDVHRTLLGRDIVTIEGLDMSLVGPGEYRMIALPLKIRNGNGSPTRVILIEEK
jgi:arylformamidase